MHRRLPDAVQPWAPVTRAMVVVSSGVAGCRGRRDGAGATTTPVSRRGGGRSARHIRQRPGPARDDCGGRWHGGSGATRRDRQQECAAWHRTASTDPRLCPARARAERSGLAAYVHGDSGAQWPGGEVQAKKAAGDAEPG
jgi:hypothetical protein